MHGWRNSLSNLLDYTPSAESRQSQNWTEAKTSEACSFSSLESCITMFKDWALFNSYITFALILQRERESLLNVTEAHCEDKELLLEMPRR